MGLTYADLQVMGSLRKVEKMGALTMFQRLVRDWKPTLSPVEVATKVKVSAAVELWRALVADPCSQKRFFHFYAVNRFKMSTLTPSYHVSGAFGGVLSHQQAAILALDLGI